MNGDVLASQKTCNDGNEGDDESREVEAENGIVVRPDDASPNVIRLSAGGSDRAVDGLDLLSRENTAELLNEVLRHLMAPDRCRDSTSDGATKVGEHAEERDGRGHILHGEGQKWRRRYR